MKKQWIAICVMAALAFTACNNKTEQKAETAPVAAEDKKVDIKLSELSANQDFVCGMPLEEGSVADTFRYEGKLYGFCSHECKDSFALKAATYLAQK